VAVKAVDEEEDAEVVEEGMKDAFSLLPFEVKGSNDRSA
jgi:hypothetical protein